MSGHDRPKKARTLQLVAVVLAVINAGALIVTCNIVWGKYAMVIYANNGANNNNNKATRETMLYSPHGHIVNVETLFGSKNLINNN